MSKLLTVSPSPHVSTDQSVKKLMYGVVLSLVPAFLVSVYLFGTGALVVTLISIASCVLFESVIQRYILKTEVRISDGSAIVTGMLLAFNLPSNLPWWMIVIGALFAIGVGKMTYGGLGNNPFNPALVGRVFLLISFPVQMTSWPLPLASRLAVYRCSDRRHPAGNIKGSGKKWRSCSGSDEPIARSHAIVPGTNGRFPWGGFRCCPDAWICMAPVQKNHYLAYSCVYGGYGLYFHRSIYG